MRRLFFRKGQSTLEYAVVTGVVVAALIGMQAYLKRGMQGKFRQSSDNIGDQFSPEHISSTFTTTSSSRSNELAQSGQTTTTISQSNTSKTGSETVETLSNEVFP